MTDQSTAPSYLRSIKKKSLYQLIQNLDLDLIHEALSNGAQINNGHHWSSNTLNLCVRSLLSHPVNEFNIQIIELLLKHGSWDHCSKNIYHETMKCYDYYVELNKGSEDEALNNILILIQTFANHGFKSEDQGVISALKTKMKPCVQIIINQIDPSDHSDTNNKIIQSVIQSQWIEMTKFIINVFAQKKIRVDKIRILHGAIKTKNMEIINLIIESYDPGTDNQTLNHAIRSRDHQIVRLMLSRGAFHNNSPNKITDNSMACALQTFDPLIIKELIHRGSVPCTRCECVPDSFWDTMMKMQADDDHILELLMCTGIRISPRIHCSIGCKKSKTAVELKISACIELQNKIYDPVDPMISELRQSLIKTMDELMELPCRKQDLIDHFDQATDLMIPVPLISIIHGYMHKSLVRYIDWSKY
jgi:hypothetical protein